MPYRYDMLFQLTTQPKQPTKAISHIAGWSESHWRGNLLDPSNQTLIMLLNARAGMLPGQAAMVGLRIGNFTIEGNRLLPGATQIRKFLKPGQPGYSCDVPQMALELGGVTNGLNSSKFSVRGIPDGQVVQGEYSPTDAWDGRLAEYTNRLSVDGWQMIGRNLSKPTYKIVSATALGVVTFSAATTFGPGDQIRILRCRDVNGLPISGVFNCSAVNGKVITLDNWPANAVVANSGGARVDAIDTFTFSDITISRVVVRKVGRPFEQYRGRRSRRRARPA